MPPLPIRSILVATDLSERSDAVIRAAAAIASVIDAQFHVLHAFDLQPLPYAGVGPEGAASFPERIAQAERALDEQLRRSLPPAASPASREIIIYTAHKAILDRAAEVSADLIVLGPHRPRRVGESFLGGTADRVIRTAHAPCLIVRGDLTLPLRTVVAPIDLSEPARNALDHAVWWTASFGVGPGGARPTELWILHVIPRVFDAADLPPDADRVSDSLRRQVENAIQTLGGGAAVGVTEEIRWGETPADEIIRYTEEKDADLLVLATHGHGAIKRALIGGVASAVARRASCPILLVPPALWRNDAASNQP